jgi:hypothetical protein
MWRVAPLPNGTVERPGDPCARVADADQIGERRYHRTDGARAVRLDGHRPARLTLVPAASAGSRASGDASTPAAQTTARQNAIRGDARSTHVDRVRLEPGAVTDRAP